MSLDVPAKRGNQTYHSTWPFDIVMSSIIILENKKRCMSRIVPERCSTRRITVHPYSSICNTTLLSGSARTIMLQAASRITLTAQSIQAAPARANSLAFPSLMPKCLPTRNMGHFAP